MLPAEFAEVVVLPTVREYLTDRGSVRRAYTACILTYSLVDHLGTATGNVQAVRVALHAACRPEYDVVQGITNGTKHAGSTSGKFLFSPGQEREVPMLTLDRQGVLDANRMDMPGLTVEHNGTAQFVDKSVQTMIRALVDGNPTHLGTVDLSFLDPP